MPGAEGGRLMIEARRGREPPGLQSSTVTLAAARSGRRRSAGLHGRHAAADAVRHGAAVAVERLLGAALAAPGQGLLLPAVALPLRAPGARLAAPLLLP